MVIGIWVGLSLVVIPFACALGRAAAVGDRQLIADAIEARREVEDGIHTLQAYANATSSR